MIKSKSRGLGRGLESLIPLPRQGSSGSAQGAMEMVAVDQIRPSAEQLRKRFDADGLGELADSIRVHGVLQPVLLRRLADGYELIAGERRWRAARIAGLERVPAIVRGIGAGSPAGVKLGADESLVLGLIENLQREDLDPIEEARGIRRLIDHFGLTHEEAAARLGRHRVAISQSLRLLHGCPALVSSASAGAISAGHARALVGLPTTEAQERGLKVVLARQLSVRQTERWVKAYKEPRSRLARGRRTAVLAELAATLTERLGAAVSITGGPIRGRIAIRYGSRQELERIVARLAG